MGLQGLVQAYSLTSLSTKEEAASVMTALTAAASKPHTKAVAAAGQAVSTPPMLLYVTPEKIVASKRLMSKLEKLYQVLHEALAAAESVVSIPGSTAHLNERGRLQRRTCWSTA
jgi:hypothetical protein